MRSAFERAVQFTLQHEGGYVNDPNDPGGETKYGISKRAHPQLDISTLTYENATEIYRLDYWNHVKGDRLPPLIAMVVFDWAVQFGTGVAAQALQQFLGRLQVDGAIGPHTVARANEHRSLTLDTTSALMLNERRMIALTRLVRRKPGQRLRYLSGWMRRTYRMALEIMEGTRELSSS